MTFLARVGCQRARRRLLKQPGYRRAFCFSGFTRFRCAPVAQSFRALSRPGYVVFGCGVGFDGLMSLVGRAGRPGRVSRGNAPRKLRLEREAA